MGAEKKNNLFSRLFGFERSKKMPVSVQFENSSRENIISLRVVIKNDVHEYRDVKAGAITDPAFLNECQLYFFSCVVTNKGMFYFEPSSTMTMRVIKKGKIIISIYFMENLARNQIKIIMQPFINR